MSQALQRADGAPSSPPVPAVAVAITSGPVVLRNLDDVSRIAAMFAQSGMFPDIRSAHQAGVKILTGAEMGFPPIASMNGVHIVKGKSSLGATLIAAAIKRHPGYDFRVKEITDQVCTVEFFDTSGGGRESLGESTFTEADARRAGTQNMGKFPRNMLHARALTNGVRWFAPDIFGGPIYTPDELGAAVDEEGAPIETAEVVELKSVPAGRAAEPTTVGGGRVGFPGEDLYAGPDRDKEPSAEVLEAEVVEATTDGGGTADDRKAEQARILSELTAMLEAVEAERESGAAPDDCLAPCELLCASDAVPASAHEFARVAALAVCRGATVPEAMQQAKAETTS